MQESIMPYTKDPPTETMKTKSKYTLSSNSNSLSAAGILIKLNATNLNKLQFSGRKKLSETSSGGAHSPVEGSNQRPSGHEDDPSSCGYKHQHINRIVYRIADLETWSSPRHSQKWLQSLELGKLPAPGHLRQFHERGHISS